MLKHYIVTIKLRSELGTKPIVYLLCGDTVFCSMDTGQSATWTVKRAPVKAKRGKRNG